MPSSGVLVGRGYVSIRPEFEGDWSRQANARGSSAGRGAGGAFSRAFGAAIRGVGGLAAVAVASNISGAAAAAAAAAPALATLGTAAGALQLGLSGVGEAFSAAFDAGQIRSDAQAAASSTRAVEAAQRGLADAQRGLADARVQAAARIEQAQRAVADAERALSDAVEDAARRQRDAREQVAAAERDLRDAQLDARQAQESLTDAREEATRALEDMNQRLAESQLDEREAVLRLREAEEELRAAQRRPGTDPDEVARRQLAYERAALNLREQRRETDRLAEDTREANRAGVEGSEQVARAQESIAGAHQAVADRQRDLARAQDDARQTGVDGARAVADAQRALADAQRGVAEARADGARQIADAERVVADAARAVADAQAAAAAQTSALDEAMARLSPNARSFVEAIRGVAPAWDAMRLGVQDALFAGLDTRISGLATRTIPTLGAGLEGAAAQLNGMARGAIDAIDALQRAGDLDRIFEGTTRNLALLRDLPAQMITGFAQLTLAAQPAFEQLLEQFSAFRARMAERFTEAFETGRLEEVISGAFDILSQLAGLLGDAFGVVGNIMRSASAAGGEILGVLGAVVAELRRITELPEVQAALRSIFQAVAQIAAALAPVVGAAVQALTPAIAAFTPYIEQITSQLAPVLVGLVTALGSALQPVAAALLPVLAQVAMAILGVVTALTPLLGPVSALIVAVVQALTPAIAPLLDLVVGLVQALAGPLASLITGLIPVVEEVGGILVDALAAGLTGILEAIEPLIPIGVQLVQDVLAALLPVLPVLARAAAAVAVALVALLPPIAELVTQLVDELSPILDDLAPVFAEVATTIAGGVMRVLPQLSSIVLSLIAAAQPLIPVIGQVAGLMVDLGVDVWEQLLPPLLDLVVATVDFLAAIAPILPPLVTLIALVLQLGVGIVQFLLPPLITVAGVLASVVVAALSLVVTWTARLISWVGDRLGPVMTWLHERVIRPVWRGIETVISTAWNNVIRPVFDAMRGFVRDTLGPAIRWLRDDVVEPVFDGIGNTVGSVWRDRIRPVLDAMKDVVGEVGDAFETARDAIGRAWADLEDLTKRPVNFIIDPVYNDGIRRVWNTVVGAFGGQRLDRLETLATGGVLPGYTPGRDIHLAALSGGEAVMRPEWTRAVGAGYVNAMNAAARQGGVAGVQRALDIPGFALGGIFEGIGDVASGAWDIVADSVDWLRETFGNAILSGARTVVEPLIDRIPGGDTRYVGVLRDLGFGMLDALITGGERADEEATRHVTYQPSAGVEQWRPTVLQALREVGQSSALADTTLRRMQQESGGNPTIVNRWDSNWLAGHPSVGLMQVIGPTFRSYAGKYRRTGPFSYGVSVDPLANVYASMRYALSRYGSLSSAYNRPGGYDDGGWLQPGWTPVYNGLGEPEAVLTPRQLRAMEGAAAGWDGDITVRVYVGDREITDIVRTEVDASNSMLASALRAGRRG